VGYINFFEINGSSNKFLVNKKNFVYLNNVDNKNFLKIFNNSKNYIVYHGSFYSDGAENADLIIPSHTVFEYDYKYLNVEGKLKKSMTVLNYPNNNISTEYLFKLLLAYRKAYLPDNFSIVNNFDQLIKQFKFDRNNTLKNLDNDAISKKNGELITVPHKNIKKED
jgi:NADH dehydrogenase/NADH:ubiquinone oxidoreductase subunit G